MSHLFSQLFFEEIWLDETVEKVSVRMNTSSYIHHPVVDTMSTDISSMMNAWPYIPINWIQWTVPKTRFSIG